MFITAVILFNNTYLYKTTTTITGVNFLVSYLSTGYKVN